MLNGTALGLALGVLLAACGDDSMASDSGGQDAGTADGDVDGGFDAGGPDAGWGVPVFRNPVGLPDDELARAALAILGAPEAGATEVKCNDCHALTRQTIRWWRAQSDVSLSSCLTDLAVSSQGSATMMLDCLRPEPAMPFETSRLGIFSTAASLEWFRYVFYTSAPATWEGDHASFVERVGMPRGEHMPLTQAEFDIVAEWFIRGVPEVDAILPLETPPDGCTPGVSSDVADHVAAMAVSGWGAVNRENGILMHGCAGTTSPTECLATETAAADTTFGAEWDHLDGATLRVLFTTDYSSSYWTRSSADGRFVAHGARVSGPGARFIDLETDGVITGEALYDPGFFPDNSGFAFQAREALFCPQSVLVAGSPTAITFTEPGCRTNTAVGLYQHLGAALGGGDYWTVDGQFESDDGGHAIRHSDPRAPFSATSRARLTPMTNDGTGFVPGRTTAVLQPYEGDTIISPSSSLILSRVAGPGATQLGFVLRKVITTPRLPPATGYDIEIPEIARYCFNGGKPAFSYDERWLVLHHYIGGADSVELGFTGPTDPAFSQYNLNGGSNIYLVDLQTGTRTRITHMAPGQYALYPHFRSDGWIYFIVRTPGSLDEHVVASDAALVIGG